MLPSQGSQIEGSERNKQTTVAPTQRCLCSLARIRHRSNAPQSLSLSVSLILCLSSLVTCLAVSLQRCPDKPPTDPSYTDAVPWLSMPIETCSSQAEEKGSKSKTFSLGIRPSFLGGPARLNQALSTSFKSCEQFNPSRVLVPEPSHFAQKSSKLGDKEQAAHHQLNTARTCVYSPPPTRSKQPKLQIHSSAGRIQGAVARTEEKHLARNR
ncbi:hypothetical protein J3E69DRAFT_319771 [Trichoderma sp. SZMC 28015]